MSEAPTIRSLTPDFAVAPQLAPEDMPTIAAEGYRLVICNRPDAEVPASHQSAALRVAAEAAGLRFLENPVMSGAMTMDNVTAQGAAIDAYAGPALAYCASGTRSAAVWALSRAGKMPTEDILNAARNAGYGLDGLAGQIDMLAEDTRPD